MARGIMKKEQAKGRITMTPMYQFHAVMRAMDATLNRAVRTKGGPVEARRKMCFHTETPLSPFFEPKVR